VVSDALRDLLRSAPGAGELTGPDVRTGTASHPVCGDEVEVFLRVADGVIAEFAWRARGCPACVAVAAAARDALQGGAPEGAERRLAERVARLGGLGPAERHALDLVATAIRSAR